MAKNFNPAKYINERARKLPIYKCYVNEGWENSNMVQVIVSRQHVNENLTLGVFLVDLLCLGVKDTFYMANVDSEKLNQILERADETGQNMMEIEYNLAHNIVYAGYEFALDSGLEAHKDFEKITKYILEEDDDKVPLIEIELGTDGVPHYMKSPYDTGTFAAKVIRALNENMGEGYYYFTDFTNDYDFDDEFDEFDEEFDEEDYMADQIELASKLIKMSKEEFGNKDGSLNAEKLKDAFLQYFQEDAEIDEISDDTAERFSLLTALMLSHYVDIDRRDDLVEKWSSDEEVMPYFQLEENLDEEEDYDILDAAYSDDFGLKEINLIKNKIKNPALADFIIFNRKTADELLENETEEELAESSEKINRLELEFKEKHPDYPLSSMMGDIEDIDTDSLTVQKVFGEEYEISIYEFHKYLQMKQKLLMHKSDLTGLSAFDQSSIEYNVDRNFSLELHHLGEAMTQMLMLHKLISEEVGEE